MNEDQQRKRGWHRLDPMLQGALVGAAMILLIVFSLPPLFWLWELWAALWK